MLSKQKKSIQMFSNILTYIFIALNFLKCINCSIVIAGKCSEGVVRNIKDFSPPPPSISTICPDISEPQPGPQPEQTANASHFLSKDIGIIEPKNVYNYDSKISETNLYNFMWIGG